MDNITSILGLLSDETKLKILLSLNKEALYVCEITKLLAISSTTASKALSKLRDANLVTFERHRKFTLYTLNRDNKNLIALLAIVENSQEYDELFTQLSNFDYYCSCRGDDEKDE